MSNQPLIVKSREPPSPWRDVELLLPDHHLDVVLPHLRGGELAGEEVAPAPAPDRVVHAPPLRVHDVHEDLVLSGTARRAVEGHATVHREQVQALVRLISKQNLLLSRLPRSRRVIDCRPKTHPHHQRTKCPVGAEQEERMPDLVLRLEQLLAARRLLPEVPEGLSLRLRPRPRGRLGRPGDGDLPLSEVAAPLVGPLLVVRLVPGGGGKGTSDKSDNKNTLLTFIDLGVGVHATMP